MNFLFWCKNSSTLTPQAHHPQRVVEDVVYTSDAGDECWNTIHNSEHA
jgi:hypothetical protein